MKFTLSWLSTFVSTKDLAPEALAEKLTMLGLEVDAVTPLYQGLDQIITAKVLTVKKHPNADRLSLCEVDTGEETVPVVCGAPNVHQGMVTAMARPGVRLPDGTKIKKAKVRGEQSLGMLCSARELGLSEDHQGIMELDAMLAPGVALTEALDLNDTMIEVDLTPNRPDCASVLGIAREVAGFTGRPLHLPVESSPVLDGSGIDFSVTIEEPSLCPRYSARKLTNVTIGPSPWWLQRQLLAVGLRPINNIVDCTNFVMLEYGQPLHAFDFKKIRQGKIVVRRPRENDGTFTTLDGVERTLEPDMLMICDGEGPVAVAGVMGGMESEVTETTTEVLLESACFDPIAVRTARRALGLHTDAATRFERGSDPSLPLVGAGRVVWLLEQHAGWRRVGPSGRAGDWVDPKRCIDVTAAAASAFLEHSLTAQDIAEIGMQRPDMAQVHMGDIGPLADQVLYGLVDGAIGRAPSNHRQRCPGLSGRHFQRPVAVGDAADLGGTQIRHLLMVGRIIGDIAG